YRRAGQAEGTARPPAAGGAGADPCPARGEDHPAALRRGRSGRPEVSPPVGPHPAADRRAGGAADPAGLPGLPAGGQAEAVDPGASAGGSGEIPVLRPQGRGRRGQGHGGGEGLCVPRRRHGRGEAADLRHRGREVGGRAAAAADLAALRGSEDAGAVQGAQRRRQLRPDRHPQHRPLRTLHRGREGHHQGHPAQLRRLPVRRLLLRRRQHGAHLPASQRAGQRAPGQGRRDPGDRQHAGGLGGRRAVRAGADHRDQFADAAVRRLAADHRQGRGLPAETAADAGCQPRQPEAGRDLPVHADGARTMNPLSFVESLFSSIGSLFSRIGSLYAQGADTAKKPWLRRIVVTLVLLVVLAGLVFLALAILPQLPMRFWQVLGLCVVALVVLWWFMAGQRKASLKGRTRKRIGDLGPGNAEDEQEPLKRMTAAIGEAKRTIARSPDIDKGRTPLYRIPWFLMIGDEASDIDGLLRAATEVSPFPPPDRDEMEPDDVWRWWFFKSMIAIEMHPRVVCDNGARLDRGIWYQALMKLADEREKLPLNGIVVA